MGLLSTLRKIFQMLQWIERFKYHLSQLDSSKTSFKLKIFPKFLSLFNETDQYLSLNFDEFAQSV